MTPQLGLTSTGNPAHIAAVAQEEETILGAQEGFFPSQYFSKLILDEN